MNIEANIQELLGTRPAGLIIGDLETALKQQGHAPIPGLVECMLRLSPRFSCKAGRWFRWTDSKAEAVIAAFERHVQTTGRHLFKAETALTGLSVESLPTAEELHSIVGGTKCFEVLRNGMIQYKV